DGDDDPDRFHRSDGSGWRDARPDQHSRGERHEQQADEERRVHERARQNEEHRRAGRRGHGFVTVAAAAPFEGVAQMTPSPSIPSPFRQNTAAGSAWRILSTTFGVKTVS